jgi:hypothetical protein
VQSADVELGDANQPTVNDPEAAANIRNFPTPAER